MLTTHWTEGQFRVQRLKRKEGNMDFVPQSINQQVVCGVARCCEMYQNINGPACGDVMVSGTYIYFTVLHNMTRHMKLQDAWHPYAEDQAAQGQTNNSTFLQQVQVWLKKPSTY